jgi:hypothetical protein
VSKITDIAAHVKQNAPMNMGIGGSLSATNRLTLAGSAIVASTWDSAPAIK